MKEEPIDLKEYRIISIRTIRGKPTVYVLADNKSGERVGLLSIDGGKTLKEV